MKAILQVNGIEIEVDVTEEQMKKLTEKKKSPFSRVEEGDEFFFIYFDGQVECRTECRTSYDNMVFAVANYCTDKNLIQQQAWRETLNRLLWRWQYENDEFIDWNNYCTSKYTITYDTVNNEFIAYWHDICKENVHYFSTEEKAYQAIEEVVKPFMAKHPDFVW